MASPHRLDTLPPGAVPARPGLCPGIHRQRGIVEGLYGLENMDEAILRKLLAGLTRSLGMTPITDPLIFSPDRISRLHHGIAGYQPWTSSGCAFYTWIEPRLFTADIYSCRPYSLERCADYLRRVLDAKHLEWRHA